MTNDVTKYIAICLAYEGKAIHRHKPYGQLEPLSLPVDLKPFKEISLDWIMGLPMSVRNRVAYDYILTIVCRVTKYVLFIPTREDITTVDLIELFFKNVECRFDSP